MIEKAVESCGFKSITACVMGKWKINLLCDNTDGSKFRNKEYKKYNMQLEI